MKNREEWERGLQRRREEREQWRQRQRDQGATESEIEVWEKHSICDTYQRKIIAAYCSLLIKHSDKEIEKMLGKEHHTGPYVIRCIWKSRLAGRNTEPDSDRYLLQIKEAYGESRDG